MRRVTFADWGYSLRRRNAAKNPNSLRIGSSQLVQLEDGRWRLGMPVVTGADEERLIGTIDAICAELAGNVLDGAITAFAEKVDELEFSHLLGQPHYLGFLGFMVACRQLIVACREEGLMPDPVDPPKGFGCHAWYGASRIMRAWSKGR